MKNENQLPPMSSTRERVDIFGRVPMRAIAQQGLKWERSTFRRHQRLVVRARECYEPSVIEALETEHTQKVAALEGFGS